MSDRIFTYGNPQLTANGRQLQRNMTLAERVIWKHWRGKQLGGCKFRRQQPFGIYVLDFVCLEAKLVIENPQTTLSTLRENVTSKGGTTAAALNVFNQHQFNDIIKQAIQACVARSQEMEKLF